MHRLQLSTRRNKLVENAEAGSGHCSRLGMQEPAARPSKVCFYGLSAFERLTYHMDI